MQTSNLDGERTLKHKQCLKQVMNIFDRVGPENFKCIVHCEAPHKDLYSFNGMIESD